MSADNNTPIYPPQFKDYTFTDIPPPTEKELPAIWDLVMQDMHDRDKVGTERYGDRLRVNSSNDPLRYAYEEALDLACYLRQALAQRDGK